MIQLSFIVRFRSVQFCDIGIVSSMKVNHNPVNLVRKDVRRDTHRLFGHFDESDLIVGNDMLKLH